MMKDGIQTFSQHQVCVSAKEPLNQLLTESIPPFRVNPPLDRPAVLTSGQWAHGQFSAFVCDPLKEGFYPCRLRKLHPSGYESTVSSLLHLVMKTMLYTPCSCTVGALFMTPFNPQFLMYGHTILSDTYGWGDQEGRVVINAVFFEDCWGHGCHQMNSKWIRTSDNRFTGKVLILRCVGAFCLPIPSWNSWSRLINYSYIFLVVIIWSLIDTLER